MKLSCYNIGKIKQASVELNSISVIAGLNNSRYRGRPLSVSYAINTSHEELDSSQAIKENIEV